MEEKKEKTELKEAKTVWSEIFEWVDTAVLTLMVLLLLFTFVFRQVRIDGSSMDKTLHDGERIIVSNLFYTPENGDIVVISSEIHDNVPIIKRVIATEGQWVDIKGGKVYVGETADTLKPIDEPYIDGQYTASVISDNRYGSHQYPLQVPENKVFLLGDNRHVSLDSRTEAIGLVDVRHILGKAIYRVYPLDKFGSIY